MIKNFLFKYRLRSFVTAAIVFFLVTAFGTKGFCQLPRPDHIVILIEENEPNNWVVGNTNIPFLGTPSQYAPSINALAADSDAAVFMGMYALTHPSQPNYLDLFAGDDQGVTGDDPPTNYPFTTPNMARQLLDKGLSFITYSEDLPYVGANDTTSPTGSYARKHNPVQNWIGTGANQVPDTVSQPYDGYFPSNYALLPTVSYVVPDEDSDMHNGELVPPIETGDQWFCEHLECYSDVSFMQWARTHNTLFILTFDEDNGTANNNIPTIFFGSMVKGGAYSQTVTLYSMLRMIEDMYSLPYAGNASTASPIDFCWKTAATGINSAGNLNTAMQVYPNPASSTLTFDAAQWKGNAPELFITDIMGNAVGHYCLPDSKKLDVDVSAYAQGVYIYHVNQNDKVVETGKFNVSR